MHALWILLGIAAALILLLLLIAFICFYITFYVPEGQKKPKEEFPFPPGDIYVPFHGQMRTWMQEARELPFEAVSIRSFDGLTLRGKYYEYAPGAPIELMLHGYRGNAERDLCGGIQRCFSLGRNVLIVDLRASGDSEGHVITFGVKESRDCRAWIDFILTRFGPESRIVLTGISMGAATVLMTAGQELPDNVVGVLADCGFTSARDIIQKTIREMKLPVALAYPFVKLGARLYGGFDLEATPPMEAVKHCHVPVIFIHGEADDYVPCKMSRQNFAACVAPKALVTVPEAGHGMAYLVDPEGYLDALSAFFTENGVYTARTNQICK